jgi:hypothetical protein
MVFGVKTFLGNLGAALQQNQNHPRIALTDSASLPCLCFPRVSGRGWTSNFHALEQF